MDEEKPFRLGVLLDETSTAQLLQLANLTKAAPLTIIINAIDTIWNSFAAILEENNGN